MAAQKWPKWVIGISSVLSFTGFLYITQKESVETSAVSAAKHEAGSMARRDGAAGGYVRENSMLDASKAEIYLFEAERMEQILNWPDERKSERERMLESLNWDADPDAEITIPAPTYESMQEMPRSNVRTRRS